MSDTPKIYVADLAAYNNGILHGRWIDATQDVDDIQQEIATMLQDSPIPDAEEHAIHDYEGFSGYDVNEYDGIETVQAIATFIEEHGDIGGLLLEHWSGDLEQAERSIEDNYCGQYKSLSDYVQELTEETTEIPESLRFYIDYAAMARDMELSGDVFTLQTGHEEVHVFWNH
ncbi:antirestriction protein ArdA [Oscillatoria sp. CS-180]|uniref:antirestriction protein ArdA n=1 Tax=Oscillatoria sp. CS-180 TaxID=3021720 RepID=UPI00232E73F2|nr:antirestriction protein ArdA [Oscillatoria sp. CS-180]MDB9524381.1 antirestriction protein ArdA [Oscillatoria sp. CS-180]